MEIDYKKLTRSIRRISGKEYTPQEAEKHLKEGIKILKISFDKKGISYPNDSEVAFLDWLRSHIINERQS